MNPWDLIVWAAATAVAVVLIGVPLVLLITIGRKL